MPTIGRATGNFVNEARAVGEAIAYRLVNTIRTEYNRPYAGTIVWYYIYENADRRFLAEIEQLCRTALTQDDWYEVQSVVAALEPHGVIRITVTANGLDLTLDYSPQGGVVIAGALLDYWTGPDNGLWIGMNAAGAGYWTGPGV